MNPCTELQMQHDFIDSTKERYGVELMADIIVPEQWGTFASEAHREKSGSHALLCAILEHALSDYQRYAVPTSRRRLRLHREAADWLFSDADDWPCHVVVVCHHLGVDLDRLRAGLKNWLTLKQASQPARPAVVEIVPPVPPKPTGGRPRSSTKHYTCQRRRMDGSLKYYHVYVVDNCTHTTYKIASMVPELEMKKLIERVTKSPMKWGPRLIADGKKMSTNTTASAEEG